MIAGQRSSDRIRIGTWNMDGGWGPAYESVLAGLRCDLLLLTEVHVDAHLDGFQRHLTSALMPHRTQRKHWAGIFASAPLSAMPDPHPATAQAEAFGVTACSSVLPWLPVSEHWPWEPADHQGRMIATVEQLKPTLQDGPVIWGGDWNQPLTGNLQGFSLAALTLLDDATRQCGLKVPTKPLRGLPNQATIDQIAVPDDWTVLDAGRVEVGDLSDHEAAYWVEVVMPTTR